MKLHSMIGTYEEKGVWRDSTGASGRLSGVIIVGLSDGKLEFDYEDGSRQVSGQVETQDRPVDLYGTLGNGKLYLGNASLTLEYTADVDGRVEYNTDTWICDEGGFRRAGLIRQADRTIWFEARMIRMDSGA